MARGSRALRLLPADEAWCLDAVGRLDEGFRTGRLAAADLGLRAREAGFTLAVARDLFVHDFGARAPRGASKDAQAPLDADRRLFREKWGDGAASRRRRTLAPPHDPPSHAATAPTPARATVSLTMIVRDEERNLPACLGSVEGLFDEIVVVDTGSADRTREVARSFGARVSDFPWVGDFAAARNEALDRATGEYAFWLDADDLLEPPERDKLHALLAAIRTGDEAAAMVVRCACDPAPDGGGGSTVVDHVRLFPLRGDVRWEYAVHEQILPALRRAKVPIRWSEVVVRHTGYANPALRARKLDRDAAILERERRARPRDPFVLFNLGQVAVERRRWDEALGHLNASLALSTPADSITRKLHALIARSHQMRGEVAEALAACDAGLAGEPDDAELLFRAGVLHRLAGDDGRAEACWIRVLRSPRGDRFGSIDVGIYGHVTRRNLAALAERRSDAREAAQYWADVLAERPDDPEAGAALARLAHSSGEDTKRA